MHISTTGDGEAVPAVAFRLGTGLFLRPGCRSAGRSPREEGMGFGARPGRQTGFVDEGVAEETDDGYIFHADKAGYDKVLGGGKLTRNIEIHAKKFSSSAERKIEEAGQETVVIEE